MKITGITKRWVLNTLGVIIALLFIISSFSYVIIRSYYYDAVSVTLNSRATDIVSTFFNLYIGGSEESFEFGARAFIEGSSDKEKMEIWVINKDGKVIISSSGFEIDSEVSIPDYQLALSSKTGIGNWTGRLQSGEKVMAMTVLLPLYNSENTGAVRYIISLEEIDAQLRDILLIIFTMSAVALFLVTVSGLFFVQSIVNPVKKINTMAKLIAKGDFNVRIDSHHYNDEIGELCETINYMASEISESDRMKNDFISTVSHELRTPLTAVKGWGETLLQIGETDLTLTEKGLRLIISEATRLEGVVDELLDFSRMQNGRMSLRTEKIDVLAELDEAVFVFRERAVREGIEFIYNVPDIPAPMNGDPNRIKQVFVNILDNALKYTEQGGIISILAEIEKDQLEISISDTGCGISAEDLPRIKEKFYKANVSVRGAGIGLAVADEIVNLHNGSLAINSILGEGTTVTVALPIETVVLADERGIVDETSK